MLIKLVKLGLLHQSALYHQRGGLHETIRLHFLEPQHQSMAFQRRLGRCRAIQRHREKSRGHEDREDWRMGALVLGSAPCRLLSDVPQFGVGDSEGSIAHGAADQAKGVISDVLQFYQEQTCQHSSLMIVSYFIVSHIGQSIYKYFDRCCECECANRFKNGAGRVSWGSSSVGRALVSHTGGLGFNSPLLHIFINAHIQFIYFYYMHMGVLINKYRRNCFYN